MQNPTPIVSQDLRFADSYHFIGKPLICRWIDRFTYPLRVTLGGREYHQRGPIREPSRKKRLRYAVLTLVLFPYSLLCVVLLVVRRVLPGSPYPNRRIPEQDEESERSSYRADLLKGE